MISLALALAAAAAGSHHWKDVETRYRAAIDTAVTCQKVAAKGIVGGLRPEELSQKPTDIKPIAIAIGERCRPETHKYFDVIEEKVALDMPGMPKRQKATADAAIEGVALELSKQAVMWSLQEVAARQKILASEPTASMNRLPLNAPNN